MKKYKLLLLIVFFAIFQEIQAKELFVDVKQITSGDGTISSPFKSIGEAIVFASSGDTLFIREGVYREQVKITKDRITFLPYQNEKVTINGTDMLLDWAKVSGSIFKSLMNWDITQSDQSNQVFCDGKMLDLLRWPVNTATILLPSNAFADNVVQEGSNYVIYDADFQELAGKWDGCEIWVNISRSLPGDGWDGQGWTGKVISATPGKIVVQGKISGTIGNAPFGLGKNTEYFLFDPSSSAVKLSGGIDQFLKSGQWWKNGDTLYVNTFSNEAPSSLADGKNLIEAKKRLYSFSFSGQSNITIKGFNTFACAINTDEQDFFNRTSSVSPSSNVLIDGIKAEYVTHFTNQSKNWQMQWVQRSGFIISGTDITLQNSEIHYSAGSGVSVIGRRNKILNNKIWDVNYSSAECGAVNTGLQYDPSLVISEDHEIGYNTIYNTPQQGINIRAFRNSSKSKPGMARIHHNIIHGFMLKTHDSGAIDTYNTDGKWIRIDHNIIFNSTLWLAIGFYMDFGTNYIVDHNLFYNVERPIQLNEGGWDPNPSEYSDVWVYNNTVMADKLGKSGILNGAGAFPAGFKIFNNITSADLKNSFPAPLVKNNISAKTTADLSKIFMNPNNQDYTLNELQNPCIDLCELAPFNDPFINKPDAGCFESGLPAWNAGYGNLVKSFVLSDDYFALTANYKTSKEFKIPVFVLPYSGFKDEVNLLVSSLSKGIFASVSKKNVMAGESFELKISVSDSAISGLHLVKLEGISGSISDVRYYTVEIEQVVTTIKITAPQDGIKYKTLNKFSAIALDQDGNPMRYQPLITWKCVGGGTISSSGTYNATQISDSVTVYASVGAVADSCKFSVSNSVSIDGINSGLQDLKVYPNPCIKFATVEFSANLHEVVELSVFSINGERLKQLSLGTSTGKNRFEISTAGLTSGIYFVELVKNHSVEKTKFVVKN